MNIRVYREETRCAHCGRTIKNVVEVDGIPLGTSCAEAFLPKGFDFAQTLAKQDRQDSQSERDALITFAYSYIKKGSPLHNAPNATYLTYLKERPHSFLTLPVIAILASRGLQCASSDI